MSYTVVSTGGHVLIGTTGGSDLFDGLGVEDCSLETSRENAMFRPHEAHSPYKAATGTSWRITLTKGLSTTDVTYANLVTKSTVYVTYKDANNVTLFAGVCTWTTMNDNQRSADFAKQSLTLENSGDPDYPVMS